MIRATLNRRQFEKGRQQARYLEAEEMISTMKMETTDRKKAKVQKWIEDDQRTLTMMMAALDLALVGETIAGQRERLKRSHEVVEGEEAQNTPLTMMSHLDEGLARETWITNQNRLDEDPETGTHTTTQNLQDAEILKKFVIETKIETVHAATTAIATSIPRRDADEMMTMKNDPVAVAMRMRIEDTAQTVAT